MKVYFSGSIAGGRKFLNTYKRIVAYLKGQGHQVLTEHIVIDNIFDFENILKPTEIYERDIKFLNEAEAVIAEISNPSLGVGYEICYAVEHQIPILCVYQPEIFVSRMIIGNTSPYLELFEYASEELLFKRIDQFLTSMFHSLPPQRH